MKALLLASSENAAQACHREGIAVTLASTLSEARALLTRGGFDLVDGKLAAAPRSLEDEVASRIALFFDRLQNHSAAGLYRAVMAQVERPLIAAALSRARGVRADAARALGIDRGTLARRVRALGLESDGSTAPERFERDAR
jgi:Fis family transcriptional regulator